MKIKSAMEIENTNTQFGVRTNLRVGTQVTYCWVPDEACVAACQEDLYSSGDEWAFYDCYNGCPFYQVC